MADKRRFLMAANTWFVGKLIKGQMYHYSSAHVEHTKELKEVGATNIHAVQVLKNMGREDSFD